MKHQFRGMMKPKVGQVWRHRKTGVYMVLTQNGEDMLRCKNICNPKVQHHIRKRVLWLWCDYLGREGQVEVVCPVVDNRLLTSKSC